MSIFSVKLASPAPNVVTILNFQARIDNQEYTISWQTASEMDLAGFNVFRSDNLDGPRIKVNADMILGKGSPVLGADYSIIDSDLSPAAYFWLETIMTDSSTAILGPAEVHLLFIPRLEHAP